MAQAGSSRRRTAPRRRLAPRAHAVYRLAPDLLLVFKPRGHREGAHAHPHRQRLRVLRGRLEVRAGARTIVVHAAGRPLTLAAGRSHSTRALDDTWLTAESLPALPARRAARK